MLYVETENSMYRVETPLDQDCFLITKILAKRESSFLAIGESKKSKGMFLRLGYPAQFDGWHTSKVTAIELKGSEVVTPA